MCQTKGIFWQNYHYSYKKSTYKIVKQLLKFTKFIRIKKEQKSR